MGRIGREDREPCGFLVVASLELGVLRLKLLYVDGVLLQFGWASGYGVELTCRVYNRYPSSCFASSVCFCVD